MSCGKLTKNPQKTCLLLAYFYTDVLFSFSFYAGLGGVRADFVTAALQDYWAFVIFGVGGLMLPVWPS